MSDTLRSIAEGMEHTKPCAKCRLEALLAEYEKVDLVKRLRTFAAASDNADWSDGINRSADELETWLAVNLERIKLDAVIQSALGQNEAQAKEKP